MSHDSQTSSSTRKRDTERIFIQGVLSYDWFQGEGNEEEVKRRGGEEVEALSVIARATTLTLKGDGERETRREFGRK